MTQENWERNHHKLKQKKRNMAGESNTKKLIIFLFSCSFLLYIHHVEASPLLTDCSDPTNYTSNTQFHTNLNLLLRSLTLNGARNGFFNDTIGTSPDTVYGIVQCRGDISMEKCRSYLKTTAVDILQRCPNRKSAALRNEECIFRYSNRHFSGEFDNNFQAVYNKMNVSGADGDALDQPLGVLMNNLWSTVESRGSKVSWGFIDYVPKTKIHGLVQCTTDLSPTNCLSCLQNAFAYISDCCYKRRGARIYSTTCYLRYELYYFFESPPSQVDASPQPSSTNRREEKGKLVAIIVPVLGVSILLLAFCTFMIIRRTRKILHKRKSKHGYDQDDMRSEDSLQFSLNTISTATNDFSNANKLGEGGFGVVYKGILDGQEVAVKRLSLNSGQGSQEFRNEVVLLHNLQHRNLVRLLGFSLSGEEKLLIYEYVPNRSLDKYIFDPTRKASLNWEKRYKIIGGVARGLLYLHEDSRLRIIHRDLKAGNILLDSNMDAKIADFGMAKVFGVNQTQGNTNKVVGTFGYMSPEYVMEGLFSVKSDVYSFGILLLEIITGQKISRFQLSSSVWEKWQYGNVLEVVDSALLDKFVTNEVVRCIHIGLLCVQDNLEDRPTMSTIILMLKSYSITLETPTRPAFMSRNMIAANDPIKEPPTRPAFMSLNMTDANDPENNAEFKESTCISLLHANYDISYDFPR